MLIFKDLAPWRCVTIARSWRRNNRELVHLDKRILRKCSFSHSSLLRHIFTLSFRVTPREHLRAEEESRNPENSPLLIAALGNSLETRGTQPPSCARDINRQPLQGAKLLSPGRKAWEPRAKE